MATAEEISTLSQDRLQVINLLKDWCTKPYEEKEMIFEPYLHFLFRTGEYIHNNRSDVNADIEILKDLLTVLEPDIAQGLRNYTLFQIAVIYANKKLGMLLQEVDRKLKNGIIIPDNEFQKWIDGELVNEDWKGCLAFADEFETEVLKKAYALGVQVEEQIITHEDINAENLDDIRKLLTMYHKEIEDAHSMPQDNVDCIGHGPDTCEFIKEIMSKLSGRCSELPDNDIKEERSYGVQSKAVDSAELTADIWTGLKKRKMEEELGQASDSYTSYYG